MHGGVEAAGDEAAVAQEEHRLDLAARAGERAAAERGGVAGLDEAAGAADGDARAVGREGDRVELGLGMAHHARRSPPSGHTRTLLSAEAVATSVPSGETSTPVISAVWPTSVCDSPLADVPHAHGAVLGAGHEVLAVGGEARVRDLRGVAAQAARGAGGGIDEHERAAAERERQRAVGGELGDDAPLLGAPDELARARRSLRPTRR